MYHVDIKQPPSFCVSSVTPFLRMCDWLHMLASNPAAQSPSRILWDGFAQGSVAGGENVPL